MISCHTQSLVVKYEAKQLFRNKEFITLDTNNFNRIISKTICVYELLEHNNIWLSGPLNCTS
jgi:hypothetical protein